MRNFIKIKCVALLLMQTVIMLAVVPEKNKTEHNKLPIIADMVHNNPGESYYQTKFNDPMVLNSMGYNAKTFFIFLSPQLAVNWDKVDPDILPVGSPDRRWVEDKAKEIHTLYGQMKKNGLQVYCMTDLILFPKRLIEKYGMQETFNDPRNPKTQQYLRILIRQMFEQFPELDGIFVRIGETYLHDAPFHKGGIKDRTNAENTIIPLMDILRDEICVKLNKKLIFRSWLSFDTNLETYLKVNNAIEPHINLIISVKHCEGDFHRGNPFSKVLGVGRHKQLLEVQCAREYEGKGAYPNYVANGVINGFEEHAELRKQGKIASIKELSEKTDLLTGMWTWSRGGGWEGPYIQNELWPELNAYVLSHWAQDTKRSEKDIFKEFATDRLKLSPDDADKFHRIALLSEKVVLKGRRSTKYPEAVDTWWTRDEYISFPKLPNGKDSVLVILAEKDTAIQIWKDIVQLAGKIKFADKATASYVKVSSEYGLHLYQIYRSLFYLSALKNGAIPANQKDHWLSVYKEAWKQYEALKLKYPDCPTLYNKDEVRRPEKKYFADPADKIIKLF